MSRPKSKKRKNKKRGMNGLEGVDGITDKLKSEFKDAKRPLSALAGLIIGKVAGNIIVWGINKVMPESPDEKKLKKFLRSAAKPIGQITAGGAIIYFGRKKQLVRDFGIGVAGSGVLSAGQMLVAKLPIPTMLKGLGAGDKKTEAEYYTENKEEILRMLRDNGYTPSLPQSTSMTGPLATVIDEDEQMSGDEIPEEEIM